ncbi:MAG: UPF0182 family membrane protein [Candidatus Xenobia bacterium]
MKNRDGLRWGLVAGLLLLLVFSRTLVGLLTEQWWYQEVHFTQVFHTLLWTRGILFVLATVGCFAFMGGNTIWALRHRSRDSVRHGNVLDFRRIGNNLNWLAGLALVPVGFYSLMAGLDASAQDGIVLPFLHAVSFGHTDPVFGQDIGLYVFRLPLLQYLSDGTFVILVATIMLVAALHTLLGGLQVVPGRLLVADAARRHLLALLGLGFLLKALSTGLDMLTLLCSTRGGTGGRPPVVFGGTYTDLTVRLPVMVLLAVLCVVVAVLIWSNLKVTRWRMLGMALAGLAITWFGLGAVLPELVQSFVVAPNEISKETVNIQRAIAATREAYGLTSVQVENFGANGHLDAPLLAANQPTVDNIPLWDHDNLALTFKQLQEIRTYYDVARVDNDRYTVDGKYQQVLLAARELKDTSLPTRNWISEHLSYTHGYGICMAKANHVDNSGQPRFLIENIPPQSQDGAPTITRPEIYFGEDPTEYCFVDTKSAEFDRPSDQRDGSEFTTTHYAGHGGVAVDNEFQKWCWFIRFGEPKILLSSDIAPGSRVMMYRQINNRVLKVTPWLSYDKDAYVVVLDGQLYWILDGYTTSSWYPYSQPHQSEPDMAGNYIRNSVKAVVNAYDGSMHFYVADPSDPIITCYSHIFPGVFEPMSAMPPGLRAHIRYPRQIFNVQSEMYATWHMDNPQTFYNKEDLWQIASADTGSMAPYYTILKLPGGSTEEFVLMIPYQPAQKPNMIAWLTARCDGDHYGQLVVYQLPKDKLVYGPSQVTGLINQDADISKSLSLWKSGGSNVSWGTLLVIPIGDTLLYVRPLYLTATEGRTMPELKAVIAMTGDQIAMAPTLQGALAGLFTGKAASAAPPTPTAPSSGGSDYSKMTMPQLVAAANDHFDAAQQKSRSGDWAGYGIELDTLRQILQEMKRR